MCVMYTKYAGAQLRSSGPQHCTCPGQRCPVYSEEPSHLLKVDDGTPGSKREPVRPALAGFCVGKYSHFLSLMVNGAQRERFSLRGPLHSGPRGSVEGMAQPMAGHDTFGAVYVLLFFICEKRVTIHSVTWPGIFFQRQKLRSRRETLGESLICCFQKRTLGVLLG